MTTTMHGNAVLLRPGAKQGPALFRPLRTRSLLQVFEPRLTLPSWIHVHIAWAIHPRTQLQRTLGGPKGEVIEALQGTVHIQNAIAGEVNAAIVVGVKAPGG